MSLFLSSKSNNMTSIANHSSRSPFPTPMAPSSNTNTFNSNDPMTDNHSSRHEHLYVLPVLLLEFLALALTRAVLPALLLNEYGNHVYMVMGAADFVRGCLAFFTCPVFGKLSDIIGRRNCLFVTVLGTCAPVCSLALFSWDNNHSGAVTTTTLLDPPDAMILDDAHGETQNSLFWEPSPTTTYDGLQTHHSAITVFIVLFSLSGVFSSTFTLVFAYISDTVKNQEERVSAYGLALATFGLSFTLGPIIGK
jgi:MFS transporter, DHA1 family, tetracycline resistance protein